MAKKRKSTHKRHRRSHRRMGATLNPGSGVMKLVALGAGYLLGDRVNGLVDKVVPASVLTATGVTKYVPAAAEIGLGGYFLMQKKKPSVVKTALSGIVAGAGIKRMLKNTGAIAGYQSVPVIGRTMHGYQSVPVIGAMPAQLNGVPEQLSGYRVNGMGAYLPQGSGSNVMGSVKNPAPVIAINGSSDYMK